MAFNNQNESASYDLSYLTELSAGDSSFIQSIISQFIAEAPTVIHNITVASGEQNWDELAYQVHKFAPNLAFIGINDIKEEVNKLEMFSKQRSNLETIPQLVDILSKRCELAINSLRKDFKL